jgi:serine protease Do
MFKKKNKSSLRGIWVLVLAVSAVSGFLGGALTQLFFSNEALILNSITHGPLVKFRQPEVRTEQVTYVEESPIIDTVQAVSPAVVSVVVTKDLPLYRQQAFNFNDFFMRDPFADPFFDLPFSQPQYETDEDGNVKKTPRKVGGGSGFIVTENGLILTNRHVVEDEAADYTVIVQEGTEYAAEVVSRDPLNDIAVLKIKDENGDEVTGFPTVKLGSSSAMKVGQRVVAIGNALAEYENTVTTGVISAKGREITAGNGNGRSEALINLLQTDAAINPGNSGGPLVNLLGEVIGINVAIAAGAQGIGFAIPIDDVKPIINSVKVNGKIVRPFLGVRFMMLDEKRADELQIDVTHGALLVGDEAKGEFAVIPGSPADKAGLQIKDVVLEVNDDEVTVDHPLQNLVAAFKPGDTVSLKVWRSGDIIDLKATLTEAD